MRLHAAAALLLAAAPAARAGLEADELALAAVLELGRVPPPSADESERLRSARAAVATARGDGEQARRLLAGIDAEQADCAERARLAELGLGTACEGLTAGALGERALEAPAAFTIVAAGEGEAGPSFPATLLSAAMRALAPAGGLEIESTPDRFRVTGSAALEGLWYHWDRILVSARAGPGRPDNEAFVALQLFLEQRPRAAAPEPPRPTRILALGLVLTLPAEWTPAGDVEHAWQPPGSAAGGDFPPAEGGLALALPADEATSAERRRHPLARRRRAVEPGEAVLEMLPAGAVVREAAGRADGPEPMTVEWTAADGAARRSLVRLLGADGRKVSATAHLGTELDEAAARRLLLSLEAAAE